MINGQLLGIPITLQVVRPHNCKGLMLCSGWRILKSKQSWYRPNFSISYLPEEQLFEIGLNLKLLTLDYVLSDSQFKAHKWDLDVKLIASLQLLLRTICHSTSRYRRKRILSLLKTHPASINLPMENLAKSKEGPEAGDKGVSAAKRLTRS